MPRLQRSRPGAFKQKPKGVPTRTGGRQEGTVGTGAPGDDGVRTGEALACVACVWRRADRAESQLQEERLRVARLKRVASSVGPARQAQPLGFRRRRSSSRCVAGASAGACRQRRCMPVWACAQVQTALLNMRLRWYIWAWPRPTDPRALASPVQTLPRLLRRSALGLRRHGDNDQYHGSLLALVLANNSLRGLGASSSGQPPPAAAGGAHRGSGNGVDRGRAYRMRRLKPTVGRLRLVGTHRCTPSPP